MNDKKVLLSIGYIFFVGDRSLLDTLDALNSAALVSREYIDGKYLYTPSKDTCEIEVKFVDSECVREATPEEKENQALIEAKRSLDWARSKNKKKDEEIENLKCKLKLLEEDGNE